MEVHQDIYRHWATRQIHLPVFYQPWYLDAVCKGGHWSAAITKRDHEIIGIWPYFIKKKYGLRYITQPHLTPTLGPLIVDQRLTSVTKRTTSLATQKKIIEDLSQRIPETTLTIVHTHPSLENWYPLSAAGYHQTTRYTYRLDLSPSIDELTQQLDSKTRNQIKSAQKEIKIKESDDGAQLYGLFGSSMSRNVGAVPFKEAYFLEYDKHVKLENARTILFATDEQGEVQAGVYLVKDAEVTYLMMTGRASEAPSGVVSALIWKAVQMAYEEGQSVFDFEGSMVPSIERFFRSFGGAPTPYHRLTKVSPSWLYPVFQAMNRV